jgi:hypothetical protein
MIKVHTSDNTFAIYDYVRHNSYTRTKLMDNMSSSNKVTFTHTIYNDLLKDILHYLEVMDYKLIIIHKAIYNNYDKFITIELEFSYKQ